LVQLVTVLSKVRLSSGLEKSLSLSTSSLKFSRGEVAPHWKVGVGVVEAFSGQIRVGGAGGEPISPEHVSRVLQRVTEPSEAVLESMGVQPAAKFAVFDQDSKLFQHGNAKTDPSSCSSPDHMDGTEQISDSQSSSKDHPARFSKQALYSSTVCQLAAAQTS
jgi:hypothetical protein